jgi:hypothetical protein
VCVTIARRQSLLAGPAGRAFLGSLARVDLQTLVRAAGIADEGVAYGIRPSVARTSRWFAEDRASETFAPRAPDPAHASAVTDLLYASVQRERRSVTQWLGESSPADVLAVLGHVVEDIAFGPQAGWRRLAGMPDSCWEPLSGLADLMTNSPSVAWWWKTLGGEQRWLGRVGESPPGSPPAGGWSSATAALDENGTWWVEPVTDGTLRTTRAIPGSSLPVSVLCRDDHARIDGERADVWAADSQGGPASSRFAGHSTGLGWSHRTRGGCSMLERSGSRGPAGQEPGSSRTGSRLPGSGTACT